jgi:hypothetical protein
MPVNRVEHAERERTNGCLWRHARLARLQGAGDDGVAGGGQQIAFIGYVPINSTRTGGELFGEGAECQAGFSAAVQQVDRRCNDAIL